MNDYDEKYGWRQKWVWPWHAKEPSAERALVGLGRMHDRLMRKHVWVYQANDKYKPVLRTGPHRKPRRTPSRPRKG